MSKNFSPALAMLAALLLTVAAYWPGLRGEFEFDDYPNIVRVDALHVSQASVAAFKNAALAGNSGPLLRPLAYLSFALNHYYFGLNPFYFKLVNLLIHLINGILLFLLGRILLAEMAFAPAMCEPLAAAAAAIWLLHPLNLTSVLYIVQRMTSLASLFMLAGLLCYAVGRRRMLAVGRGQGLIIGALCGFGLLALASKETAVLLPVYMLVVEVTVFRWRVAVPTDRKFLYGFFTATVALPVLLAVPYLLSGPEWFAEGYQSRDFTLIERLMTETRVLWFYLSLILYPDITRMGLYHDDITISRGLLSPPTTLAAILGIIVLIVIAARSSRRTPLLALAVFWFLAGHVLESTILPLEIAHEHRNYLPAYGPLLATTWALTLLARAATHAWWRFAPAALFFVLILNNTFARAWDFGEYAGHTVEEAINHPQSARSLHALGWLYFRIYLKTHDTDTLTLARNTLKRAAELDQIDILPYRTLVMMSYEAGVEPDPTWFSVIKHRLNIDVPSHSNLAYLTDLVFCQRAYCKIPSDDMAGIFDNFSQNPRNGRRMTAEIYNLRAVWEGDRGRQFEAGEYLKKAIALNQDDAMFHVGLANWYAQMGNKESAYSELAIATKLDPLGRYQRAVVVNQVLQR
ncbi:MAG TPA: pilus assembly protein PilF [Gammaproteobacteria bacterium]|nr:pilus assembly protein PilF [Gammaproteobacteria bacterium]